jgi:hypothetical protein
MQDGSPGYGFANAMVYTTEEDARLIAAAPELLEVCRKLLAWQSEDDPYACDDWMEFATDLGAMAGHAIAKAEGVTMEGPNGKERSLD